LTLCRVLTTLISALLHLIEKQRLRELSFVFPAKSIGITICRAPTHGSNISKNAAQVRRHLDIGVDLGFPAMVEVVRGGPAVGILNPGDMVSKVRIGKKPTNGRYIERIEKGRKKNEKR
jgi:hypothetical protein